MATFERFEEIEAWKKARELVSEIYAVSAVGAFARDYALRDQVRRAGVSIMANIAEGFGRNGRREFHQFLSNAKGSAAEVQSHLYVACDQRYITAEELRALYDKAEQVGRMINGLMRYLRTTKIAGIKYTDGDTA